MITQAEKGKQEQSASTGRGGVLRGVRAHRVVLVRHGRDLSGAFDASSWPGQVRAGSGGREGSTGHAG